MKGCVISSVIGDGDWVVAINYALLIKLLLILMLQHMMLMLLTVPSQDDYINSVKELIKSQKTGYTVPLDEVIDGKRTGKKD
jgi:hypothetical protein